MRITPKMLALIAALVLAVAVFIGWLAIGMIVDSRHMTNLCGTTMSDYGIVEVSSSLVVVGVLVLAGVGMFVKAWMCWRSARRSETKSAT